MKNNKVSLIISIIALAGVILLFVAYLSKDNNNGKSQSSSKNNRETPKIAFVNVDSALASYDLYNALSLQLMQKQQELQNQLQSKMLSLQNRMSKLQNQYSQHLITSQKYQQQAQSLSNEQMQLQQWQEEKSLELNEDQVALNERVYDSIKNVIKIINNEGEYDLVISNAVGGTLLYGNPKWNITGKVIKLLNKRVKNSSILDTNATSADSLTVN